MHRVVKKADISARISPSRGWFPFLDYMTMEMERNCYSATGKECAMTLRATEILRQIRGFNAIEIEKHRVAYVCWTWLNPGKDLFEAYVEKNANFVRTGDISTKSELDELAGYSEIGVPEELRAFYLIFGKLSFGGLDGRVDIFSVERQLADLRTAARKSIGLMDTILFDRGCDRSVVEAVNGRLGQTAFDRLNAEYKCIGWFDTDVPGNEREYIHYDHLGNFGTVVQRRDTLCVSSDGGSPERQCAGRPDASLSRIVLRLLHDRLPARDAVIPALARAQPSHTVHPRHL